MWPCSVAFQSASCPKLLRRWWWCCTRDHMIASKTLLLCSILSLILLDKDKTHKQTWRSTSSSLRLCQTLELDLSNSCGQKFYLLRDCASTLYSWAALVQWNSCHTIWEVLLIFCETIWIPQVRPRQVRTGTSVLQSIFGVDSYLLSLIWCQQRVDRQWLASYLQNPDCTDFLGALSRTQLLTGILLLALRNPVMS